MKELVAVVLAGGGGTRFWPLSTDKILFPFLHKPLVHYSVEQAVPKDVSRVVIVANERNTAYFDSQQWPMPISTVLQTKAEGMAAALQCARPQLKNCSLLILIADDVLEPSLLQQVVDQAKHTDAFAVLPGLRVTSYFPGGYLNIVGNKVVSIIEKPGEGKQPSDFVNISGHYISDSERLFAALDTVTTTADDHYEQALTQLMKHETFEVLPYEGEFASLKYPWHVLQVQDILLQRIIPTPYIGNHCDIKSSVIIEGNVYISDHVKIFENTKITGPCYIGPHTIIGNNNIIRHSSVGAHCVTGFNTDITRSYIGDHCWFHTNYIGDSIVEGHVSMGSGAVLANLRLDEQAIGSVVKGKKVGTGRNKLGSVIGHDVRIGVNASIMPGVKIGSRSFIGAGVVLSQDVPDESLCVAQQQQTITQNTKQLNSDARKQFRERI